MISSCPTCGGDGFVPSYDDPGWNGTKRCPGCMGSGEIELEDD